MNPSISQSRTGEYFYAASLLFVFLSYHFASGNKELAPETLRWYIEGKGDRTQKYTSCYYIYNSIVMPLKIVLRTRLLSGSAISRCFCYYTLFCISNACKSRSSWYVHKKVDMLRSIFLHCTWYIVTTYIYLSATTILLILILYRCR